MTHYVPMYDNVGHQAQSEEVKSIPLATITSKRESVKYYAKLSPDTLLRQRTECEEYQVPAVDPHKKSASSQMKSNLVIAVISVLLMLLLIATVTAVTLASIEWKSNAKLSARLQEMHIDIMETMKEEVTSLRNILKQTSFEKCLKDVANCSMTRHSDTIASCETTPLPINITVSQYNNILLR